MLRSKIASSIAHGFHTSAIAVSQKLSNQRPARQYFLNHVDFSPGSQLLLCDRVSFELRKSEYVNGSDSFHGSRCGTLSATLFHRWHVVGLLLNTRFAPLP